MRFVTPFRWRWFAGAIALAALLVSPSVQAKTKSAARTTRAASTTQATPSATLTNITQFSSVSGLNPQAAVIQGADGAFYGTTQGGGAYNNGTIFRRAADGTITLLHSFNNGNDNTNTLDGYGVVASLVQGPDGAFYGVAQYGGTNGDGTVFKLAADQSTFTVLHNFGYTTDGAEPLAGLFYNAQDGLLYGATLYGHSNGGTLFSISTDGATFNILHQFNYNTEGEYSSAPLIQDANGVFYGTLRYDGTSGSGALFSFTVANNTATLTILHSFGNEGANASYYPYGRIVLDNGVLYGTTADSNNGYGTVYALTLNPGGTAAYNVLHFFPDSGTDGNNVQNGLALLNGTLYGEATNGGIANNGTIFSLGEDGSAFTVLHTFAPATDGYNVSLSNLTVGTDGNLYGVAPNGGQAGQGTLFQVTLAGTFAVLNNFLIDRQDPEAALVQGADGAFYGTTQNGGAYDDGTIFRVDASGAITTLHEFSGMVNSVVIEPPAVSTATATAKPVSKGRTTKANHSRTPRTAGAQPNAGTPTTNDGANPIGALIQGANGLFYGTTQNGGDNNNGEVFSISADGTAYTILHSFAAYTPNTNSVNADGSNPVGALVVGQDGNLYGVTNNGGASGYGTVYRLALDGSGFALVQTFTGGQANPAYPGSGLTVGPDGSFYGATEGGGPFGNGNGTVYKISPDGATLTLLHAFTGTAPEGYRQLSAPVFGADGFLYGGTYRGGNFGDGTLYKVSTDGATFTTLYNFSYGDGYQPESALLASADGYLYGTTTSGGVYGSGVIYRLSTDGDVRVIYNFSTNGGEEGRVARSKNSARPIPAAIAPVPSPADRANGSTANLIQGADGFFYGTSSNGGTSGDGSVYRVGVSPVITSASAVAAAVNTAFSFTVTAEHNPTSFAASGLPTGLTIDATTGVISGTPTTAGTFPVTVTATNEVGADTQTLTIVVQAAPVASAAPMVNSAASANAVLGQAFSYQITANNGPTNYGAAGLPAGLSVDTVTGIISGTPTATGTYAVSLSAKNSAGTGTATLALKVTTVADVTPTVTSPASANAQAGLAFAYQITASNTPSSFGATGLPTGLTINATTGLISGTPTTAGSYTVTLSATNANGTGTAGLTLTVTAAALTIPVVNSATTASGQVAVAFSYQITASNSPIVFGATGLPTGLSVDVAKGLISGTPREDGTFTVTLTAANSAGTGTGTLTLTVAPQPLPVIDVAASVPSVTLGTGQTAEFVLTRTGGDSTQTVVVNYTVGGTAVAGTDYVTLKGSKAFKPGKTTVRIIVTPEGTPNGAANKSLKLTLQPGDGYTLGTAVKTKVKFLATAP